MPKKRALGEETINRMTAGAVVIPFIARIGPMVDRATFLETIATRDSPRRPSLRQEAAMLAEEARRDLEHLDEQLAAMPPGIALHSRIADTRRALVAVVNRFERARLAL